MYSASLLEKKYTQRHAYTNSYFLAFFFYKKGQKRLIDAASDYHGMRGGSGRVLRGGGCDCMYPFGMHRCRFDNGVRLLE